MFCCDFWRFSDDDVLYVAIPLEHNVFQLLDENESFLNHTSVFVNLR